jgi:hypothetical protein
MTGQALGRPGLQNVVAALSDISRGGSAPHCENCTRQPLINRRIIRPCKKLKRVLSQVSVAKGRSPDRGSISIDL